jgi:hypothetical protein
MPNPIDSQVVTHISELTHNLGQQGAEASWGDTDHLLICLMLSSVTYEAAVPLQAKLKGLIS